MGHRHTTCMHRPLFDFGALKCLLLGPHLHALRATWMAGFYCRIRAGHGHHAARIKAALDNGTSRRSQAGARRIYPVENTDLPTIFHPRPAPFATAHRLQPTGAAIFPAATGIIAGWPGGNLVSRRRRIGQPDHRPRWRASTGRDVLWRPGHPRCTWPGLQHVIRDGGHRWCAMPHDVIELGPARKSSPVAPPLHQPTTSPDRNTAALHIEISVAPRALSPVAEDQLLRDWPAPAIATTCYGRT